MTGKPKPHTILMGIILRPHGIRGDMFVKSFTEVPADITSYGPLDSKDGQRQFELSLVRETHKGLTVHITGVDDRTSAETLTGTELYISRHRLPEPADNSFYHADLVGLRAVSIDGKGFGTITAVENFGASDILEIKLDQTNGVEMVPFVEAFVPEVSLDAGTVTVILPETPDDQKPINTDET